MQDQNKNVYGQNVPAENEQRKLEGEEQSTADHMDEVREETRNERPASGGMGRNATPAERTTQGEFQGVGEEDGVDDMTPRD